MIFTTIGFFVDKSLTVTVWLVVSTAVMVPATLRNVPKTISLAASDGGSLPRVPRARNWSPGLMADSELTFASSKCGESGAYWRTMVSLAVVTETDGPPGVVGASVIVPVAASTDFTGPKTPLRCQSSSSFFCRATTSDCFMTTTLRAVNAFLSSDVVPRARMRSPAWMSDNCAGVVVFRSAVRATRAPSGTVTAISAPSSDLTDNAFPCTDFTTPAARDACVSCAAAVAVRDYRAGALRRSSIKRSRQTVRFATRSRSIMWA